MKKNNCYIITAIANIVSVVMNFISALSSLLLGEEFYRAMLMPVPEDMLTAGELAEIEEIVSICAGFSYILLVVGLVAAIVGIISAVKFFKFARENEKSSSVVVWIVLDFIFCGALSGILGIVGYVNCDTVASSSSSLNAPIATQTSTTATASSSVTQTGVVEEKKEEQVYTNVDKLKDLQKLRMQNIITKEEYEEKRLQILEQSNKDDNN